MRPAIRALVAAGAGAAALAAAFIAPHEGLSLQAYRDSVGVWTICRGSTTGVRPGDRKTREQCEELFASEVGQFLEEVDRAMRPEIPAPSMAAITSLCFNVGLPTCRPVIARVNEGRLRDACNAITLYTRAGGKDCRRPDSNCRGIITRREDERELCLAGLEAGS